MSGKNFIWDLKCVDQLMVYCGISIADTLEIPQLFTKPLIYGSTRHMIVIVK